MEVTIDDLRDLLAKAYDAGWLGAKDVRDATVDQIIEEYKNRNESRPKEKEFVGWHVNFDGTSEMVTLDAGPYEFSPITVEISEPSDVEAESAYQWDSAGTMTQRFFRFEDEI